MGKLVTEMLKGTLEGIVLAIPSGRLEQLRKGGK
ncbi:hypothetical protein SAMN05216275_1655 [Streptosporangium canum]|uniref:Uncharacterized protein n=1 Tax=Streptosporangium canum TaxID=324952 RepID=A0A1I4FII8_9ACTN|nr:hypothetical protein SAMN05216275_1655 [Streptosporangium canum]